MKNSKIGQYGKRNPLFMYQCAAGYSIKAKAIGYSAQNNQKDLIFKANPDQSGTRRCGMAAK